LAVVVSIWYFVSKNSFQRKYSCQEPAKLPNHAITIFSRGIRYPPTPSGGVGMGKASDGSGVDLVECQEVWAKEDEVGVEDTPNLLFKLVQALE
jgi:hypothetical protein